MTPATEEQTAETTTTEQATSTGETQTTVTAAQTAAATETSTEQAAETTTETKTEQTSAAPETYDLALPKDSLLATEDAAFVAAEAKALGLSNQQAQSLLDARSAVVQASATAFLSEAKADPEIGGAKFEQTVTHAKAGLAFVFPNEQERAQIEGWFNRTGLGNHKLFLAAMARVGKARAEDTGPGSGTSGHGGGKARLEDRLFDKTRTA